MRVTLVFDNLGIQDIEKKHIIRLNFEKLKRKVFYRLRFLNKGAVYECNLCEMVIDSNADQPTNPNIPISSGMINTTVFQNILGNTISAIEIEDDYKKRTVFVPSKVENGRNQWQTLHKDARNNLHIRCQRYGKSENKKELIV